MRDGGYQVLVADGSHAPQCACARLWSCDACKPQMQSIYEVWNLREMNTAEENTVTVCSVHVLNKWHTIQTSC